MVEPAEAWPESRPDWTARRRGVRADELPGGVNGLVTPWGNQGSGVGLRPRQADGNRPGNLQALAYPPPGQFTTTRGVVFVTILRDRLSRRPVVRVTGHPLTRRPLRGALARVGMPEVLSPFPSVAPLH